MIRPYNDRTKGYKSCIIFLYFIFCIHGSVLVFGPIQRGQKAELHLAELVRQHKELFMLTLIDKVKLIPSRTYCQRNFAIQLSKTTFIGLGSVVVWPEFF